MKLALTVLARDEADVIDAHVRFHSIAGVDVIIATDHRSLDGTAEILEAHARDGRVRLFRESGERIRQSEWMTRMARLAATEYGADWVISSDADEFWWPRGGTLKDVLALVPARYGVVRVFSYSFVPRAGDGAFFERMTARLAAAAPINDPGTPFRPVAKVLYRADPRVVVGPGNHGISGVEMLVLDGVFPLELMHFPLRSSAQVARKHENTVLAWEKNLRGDLARARTGLARGSASALYERLVVDDRALERGLAAGTLVTDTRLRDAMRMLANEPDRPFGREDNRGVSRQMSHAAALTALFEANVVRLQRRVDELEARFKAGRSAA